MVARRDEAHQHVQRYAELPQLRDAEQRRQDGLAVAIVYEDFPRALLSLHVRERGVS
jgi:hypothetical protein